MSVSLSVLLDAPEDILHEWCLAVCFPLPGRKRCFVAARFKETHGLFSVVLLVVSLTNLLKKHAIHIVVFIFSIIHVVQPEPIAGYFRQAVRLYPLLSCELNVLFLA